MSEENRLQNADRIVELAQEAKEEAERLYNSDIKKAATTYRNLMLEITKVIKEERPIALEYSKNIKKK